MINEVNSIESRLRTIEEEKGYQEELRTEFIKVKIDLEELQDKASKEGRFNWWTHGIQPIIMLTSLILLLKNKEFLAEQTASCNH